MYFNGVNRGIAFTKAGAYTTGLVFVLGLLATSSGSNAFFIALGFGLSLLTISGLLSERSMKHFEFLHMESTVADSGRAFLVPISVRNASPDWYLFGIETLVLLRKPKFRLLNARLEAPIEARLLVLEPGETRTLQARCQGMPRGYYDEFFIVHRTLFPFGLISKFKTSRSQGPLSISPAVDETLLANLCRELTQHSGGFRREQEFHHHRPMLPRDPWRDIDWKKNAARSVDSWVIKVHHSPAALSTVTVRVDWNAGLGASSEQDYELLLSRARTAVEAVSRCGYEPLLQLPQGGYLHSLPPIVEFLTRAPRFLERKQVGLGWAGVQALSATQSSVWVGIGDYQLELSPKRGVGA